MLIDPEISVIVLALMLASTMSGCGRPMCPLNVLCPSVCTYKQPLPVCTHVQSVTSYGHLFSVPSNLHHLEIISLKGCKNTKVASPHFNSHHKCHIEVAIPCVAASAHTILL